ncbi:MAG: hypothetical protein A2201_06335, partial [Alicyclobacillus sp. RIFOXYA1_FULL_53_8]
NLGPRLLAQAQVGLTSPQAYMLYFIQKTSHCTVSQLAEKMEVKPSAITVMLDRLEHHGFVLRVRDEIDRRLVRVELTSQGTQMLDKVMGIKQNAVQRCLLHIPPEELAAFLDTFEKLAEITVQTTAKESISHLESKEK